ncbi:MAG: hypothetical protein L7V86_02470 [Verrucomicrobiales bacterium]|nr:hypothetical protein [Verrucomicrobiales bacterium]
MMNSSHVCPAFYVCVSLYLHAQAPAPEKVGGLEVVAILEMLGAKQEDGVSAEQRRTYGKHFGFVDLNGDGLHSAEEFIEKGNYLTPQARRGIFTAADADQDGLVTEAEYVLNRIITDEAKALMQALDDDDDGLVSRGDFDQGTKAKLPVKEQRVAVFQAFDRDENGLLETPEYLRVWGAWARDSQKPAEARLREAALDALWAEVSRSVMEGDFAGYSATCHPDGVLVSGSKAQSYPLSKALAGWKQGFEDTKAGKMKASVAFRFSQRFGDATTAHETGIFLYTSEPTGGEANKAYIDFEALLLKDGEGEWKVMMEYQKSAVNEEAWEALAK